MVLSSRGNLRIRDVIVLFAVAATLTMAIVSCGSEVDRKDEVETADAIALVKNDLLIEGEIHLTVQAAEQAYNEAEDATAVAAMVSVTGADSLCMFWFVEGRAPGDGLIIGDVYARQFSPFGASVVAGSAADQTVSDMKTTREGIAVLSAVGSGLDL